jgi:hypothetical protein
MPSEPLGLWSDGLAMNWGTLGDGRLQRLGDRISVATLLSLALFAGGCGSGGGFGGPSATTAAAPSASAPAAPPTASPPSTTSSSSFGSKISSFFSNSSATSHQSVTNTSTGAQQANLDCPMMDIRNGASTLQIPPPTEDQNSTMSLKYQGTFVRAARECAAVNQQMVMKVGVEGRIIVGPAGGPGQVDVPLRIAVVDETTAGTKMITTKFIRIPVTVAPGQGSVDFSHVEEGLSFPMPSAADLDSYVVYIGFDPLAEQAQDREKEKPKPKPKPKVKPTAPTG